MPLSLKQIQSAGEYSLRVLTSSLGYQKEMVLSREEDAMVPREETYMDRMLSW